MKAALASRSTSFIIWIVAVLVAGIDQWSKAWALRALPDSPPHTVVPHTLDFVFVRNTHGAYGLFGDQPWFLIAISFVAFIVIYLSFRERAQHSIFVASSLGLVLGGAIGNVIDRLHYHFVVDFIRILPLPIFEVFNLADTAISVGIVLILIISLTRNEPHGEATH